MGIHFGLGRAEYSSGQGAVRRDEEMWLGKALAKVSLTNVLYVRIRRAGQHASVQLALNTHTVENAAIVQDSHVC